MRTVHVEWVPTEGRFTALGSHADQVLSINAPQEGRRPPTGFSASELLLAGVGSCSAWDVVEILRKGRQEATSIEVRVTGEQSSEPPWPYQRIELHYLVRGRNIPERSWTAPYDSAWSGTARPSPRCGEWPRSSSASSSWRRRLIQP